MNRALRQVDCFSHQFDKLGKTIAKFARPQIRRPLRFWAASQNIRFAGNVPLETMQRQCFAQRNRVTGARWAGQVQ